MKQDYKRMLSVDDPQVKVALDEAIANHFAILVQSEIDSDSMYDQARFTLAADQAKRESLKQHAQVQLGNIPDSPVSEEAQRQLDHSLVRGPSARIVTQVDAFQTGGLLGRSTS
jgi:hypothetical protein